MQRAICLLVLSSSLSAADLTVAPGGSIQGAIDLAVDGDRVLVSAGTYLEQIDFQGKAIEVIGVDGSALTTLDSGGPAPVVRFANGEGAGSVLQGFTVTGGHASYGPGGISCTSGAQPRILDSLIVNNTGRYGAGIAGSPTLERCTIRDNTSSLTHGGGVYGAPQMRHCLVVSNTATSASGGGLYLLNGTASLEDCVILENSAVLAGSRGGGIYIDSSATVTITRCVIAGNFSTGGVFAGYGGGVRVESTGSVMQSCTVVDNSVTGSSTYGGGIYGPLTVNNSIVRGNNGGQVDGGAVLSWCDVEGGYAGVGNVDLAPEFVDATGSDYHLLATSPLIDLGDPALTDPDGSRADMGAHPFQSLYGNSNGLAADWNQPSLPEISGTVGGRQVLQVLAGPQSAGELYLLLGSITGTSPGFTLFDAFIPLTPDVYTLFTLTDPNSTVLASSFGTLDGDGRASATFTFPAGKFASLVGTTLYHAAVADTPGASIDLFVTNPLSVAIVP